MGGMDLDKILEEGLTWMERLLENEFEYGEIAHDNGKFEIISESLLEKKVDCGETAHEHEIISERAEILGQRTEDRSIEEQMNSLESKHKTLEEELIQLELKGDELDNKFRNHGLFYIGVLGFFLFQRLSCEKVFIFIGIALVCFADIGYIICSRLGLVFKRMNDIEKENVENIVAVQDLVTKINQDIESGRDGVLSRLDSFKKMIEKPVDIHKYKFRYAHLVVVPLILVFVIGIMGFYEELKECGALKLSNTLHLHLPPPTQLFEE